MTHSEPRVWIQDRQFPSGIEDLGRPFDQTCKNSDFDETHRLVAMEGFNFLPSVLQLK